MHFHANECSTVISLSVRPFVERCLYYFTCLPTLLYVSWQNGHIPIVFSCLGLYSIFIIRHECLRDNLNWLLFLVNLPFGKSVRAKNLCILSFLSLWAVFYMPAHSFVCLFTKWTYFHVGHYNFSTVWKIRVPSIYYHIYYHMPWSPIYSPIITLL